MCASDLPHSRWAFAGHGSDVRRARRTCPGRRRFPLTRLADRLPGRVGAGLCAAVATHKDAGAVPETGGSVSSGGASLSGDPGRWLQGSSGSDAAAERSVGSGALHVNRVGRSPRVTDDRGRLPGVPVRRCPARLGPPRAPTGSKNPTVRWIGGTRRGRTRGSERPAPHESHAGAPALARGRPAVLQSRAIRRVGLWSVLGGIRLWGRHASECDPMVATPERSRTPTGGPRARSDARSAACSRGRFVQGLGRLGCGDARGRPPKVRCARGQALGATDLSAWTSRFRSSRPRAFLGRRFQRGSVDGPPGPPASSPSWAACGCGKCNGPRFGDCTIVGVSVRAQLA